jgi:hypothetical protein
LVKFYHFLILEGIKVWSNPSPTDKRSFHAVGDVLLLLMANKREPKNSQMDRLYLNRIEKSQIIISIKY